MCKRGLSQDFSSLDRSCPEMDLDDNSSSSSEMDEDRPASKRRRFSMGVLVSAIDSIGTVPAENEFSERAVLQLFDYYEGGTSSSSPGSPVAEPRICGSRMSLLEEDFGWPNGAQYAQTTYFAFRFCMHVWCGGDLGLLTRSQWLTTFSRLRVSTLERVKHVMLDYQYRIRRCKSTFKAFYNFVFKCINRGAHRSIDNAVAQKALIAVMGSSSPFTFSFCQFLSESRQSFRGVTEDQWRNFLPFSATVARDLSNYSPEDSWPTMFDLFVEWVRKRGVRFCPSPTPTTPTAPAPSSPGSGVPLHPCRPLLGGGPVR